MFSTVLIETLKRYAACGNPSDSLQLLADELGWQANFAVCGSSGNGHCISPCGRYVFKHCYIPKLANNHVPKDAVPTEFIREVGRGYYFLLQRRASIRVNAQRRAYKILGNREGNRFYDLKVWNCGFLGLRPVLIDW